ncbi:hypothetical protein SAMN02745975_03561 [Geosporobacter subterraneus DSM 17957]|uniref:Uncharacterized protein n=1 Tax=Geosporobacter subterraneus DSM 17957 TaxID=1121919 RepID=A0A1M6PEZ9_9FIRM|nr:hypothetical protein [Clostridium sp. Cult2]SHK06516.1 hypothetical protein SAMN02745975_03561 [Geosporobacter subterraneus DSM 17957]
MVRIRAPSTKEVKEAFCRMPLLQWKFIKINLLIVLYKKQGRNEI